MCYLPTGQSKYEDEKISCMKNNICFKKNNWWKIQHNVAVSLDKLKKLYTKCINYDAL